MNQQGPGKIEWTDYTWSPVTGCQKGCSYCYANRIAQRIYPEKFEPTFRPKRLSEPFKLEKPSKIFVCDMGDLFGEWVPYGWMIDVFDAATDANWHTYQFLTKNPKRYEELSFNPNHWLGTTVESEETAHRMQTLMNTVHVDDNIAFVSFEPLLGPVKSSLEGLDWIIIGERSDTPYNPEVEDWAESLITQARFSDIPVFVKNRLKKKFPFQEWPHDPR